MAVYSSCHIINRKPQAVYGGVHAMGLVGHIFNLPHMDDDIVFWIIHTQPRDPY